MDSKLTPLQIVARELATHSTMSSAQIESALSSVLEHLMHRAEVELSATRQDSTLALELARQYQATSEAFLFLGSQLIAFEDIEADDDSDDEWDPKN